MNVRVVGALLFAIAAYACADDHEVAPADSTIPTASPRVSQVVTLTPGGETGPASSTTPAPSVTPPGFDDFREFGSTIDEALQTQDIEFFLRDPIITTVECPNAVSECSTPIVGINVGLWQSEAIPLPVDDFRWLLADTFATGVQLHALATLTHDFGGAIGGPVDIAVIKAPPEAERDVNVLFFERDGSQWRLKLLMDAGLPHDESNPWESGNCLGNCYDYWEPWEGATD